MRSKEVYNNRLQIAEKKLSELATRDRIVGIARLVSAILAIVFLYRYFISLQAWNIYVFICLVIGFLLLLPYHRSIRKKRERWKAVVNINTTEIKALDGDYTSLDSGEEFNDIGHLFSSDLHLFGEYSLFKHLNRTITEEGKDLLARELLKNNFYNTLNRQEAVRELSPMQIDREQFLVHRNTTDISPHLLNSIHRWKEQSVKIPVSVHPLILISFSLLCIATFIYFAIYPSTASFYVFVGTFIFNLIYHSFHSSRIDQISKHINKIARPLLTLSRITEWIEKREFEGVKLTQIKNSLESDNDPVSRKLGLLSGLTQTLESRENIVGSVIANGLFFLHLHNYRRLLKWKVENIQYIEDWIMASARMDVYISLSNYAYNHPENKYPHLNDKPELSFDNLRHPLMIHQENIGNSFHLEPGETAILTGSNMAGKSTFLRTIGTNLVLAKLGVPIVGDKMNTYPFQIATSMQVSDALSENTSYFLAEVLRLKTIMDFIQQSDHTLLLIDEILRGTNSIDKKSGTIDVLNKLNRMPCSTILATHDIAVAKHFNDTPTYSNWYFMSSFRYRELVFDYKLREGISTNPNARILLHRHGVIEEE